MNALENMNIQMGLGLILGLLLPVVERKEPETHQQTGAGAANTEEPLQPVHRGGRGRPPGSRNAPEAIHRALEARRQRKIDVLKKNPDKTFGEQLKLARIKRGMTLEDTARLVDCSIWSVMNAELGSVRTSRKLVAKIAQALSVPLEGDADGLSEPFTLPKFIEQFNAEGLRS